MGTAQSRIFPGCDRLRFWDFARIGRTLSSLCNGRHDDLRYPKAYAEKFILDPERQRSPAHFHRSKRKDIIVNAASSF